MRALRTVALVLALWAVAATVVLDLPAWIGTPSPNAAELPPGLAEVPKRKRERMEEMIAWAGAAAVGCLVLASLIGLGKRLRPAEQGQRGGTASPPDAGPADGPDAGQAPPSR